MESNTVRLKYSPCFPSTAARPDVYEPFAYLRITFIRFSRREMGARLRAGIIQKLNSKNQTRQDKTPCSYYNDHYSD